MTGDIEIRVNLTETGAKNDLILDWRTTQFQNDKDKPYARHECQQSGGKSRVRVERAFNYSERFIKNRRKHNQNSICLTD